MDDKCYFYRDGKCALFDWFHCYDVPEKECDFYIREFDADMAIRTYVMNRACKRCIDHIDKRNGGR